MSTDIFGIVRYCWTLFMGILTFLATHTALGAWISRLPSRFGEKTRSWGFKWPEPPVSPDRQELRDAQFLRDLLRQNLDATLVMSQLLRDMMDQDTNHHEEMRVALSDSQNILFDISSDAHRIAEVTAALPEDVRVMVTSEVESLLRKLPQSIREAKNPEPRVRHMRAASA
ncbi:hypothetical protein diail_5443 [Diaporthe ilicicola]|nr:hypothetical protein diail_5443 [Diaporthe ilicicola]